jgi:hypothetical protein
MQDSVIPKYHIGNTLYYLNIICLLRLCCNRIYIFLTEVGVALNIV